MMRVFLVENELLVRKGLRSLLELRGYSFAELQGHTCLRYSWEAERPSWRYRRSACRS